MNPERGLERIKGKDAKKTEETLTDETLFEGFYSLERPTLEGLEKLENLKQAIILSRIPPPYEETLKLVKKREKILSKEKNSLWKKV